MEKFKSITFGIVFVFPLAGLLYCQEKRQREDITCKEAYELIRKHKGSSDFVIIDFRPEDQYNKAHIKDAIFCDVFLDDVDIWLNQLDKNKTYLLYCNKGTRSGIALEKMKKLGFKNLYHIYQGIKEWKKQGHAVIKE